MAEERISQFEGTSIETPQTEKQTEQRLKKQNPPKQQQAPTPTNPNRISKDNLKKCNRSVTALPEGERERYRRNT